VCIYLYISISVSIHPLQDGQPRLLRHWMVAPRDERLRTVTLQGGFNTPHIHISIYIYIFISIHPLEDGQPRLLRHGVVAPRDKRLRTVTIQGGCDTPHMAYVCMYLSISISIYFHPLEDDEPRLPAH